MSKLIDKEQVLKTLHELVDEFGEDYQYPFPERFPDTEQTCFYSNDDGTPSCAAGHVFSRLTPELYEAIRAGEEQLHRSFSLSDPRGTTLVVGNKKKSINDYFTDDAILTLSIMQSLQDGGESWGYALECTEAKEF